ncbi:MAG: hypothetical protein Q9228_006103, partial [Teloschistes exilis]
MSDPAPQTDGNPALPLTTKDLTNLARPDSSFTPHTWSDLAHIIATNDLESLRRRPSDLKRYDQWTRETKETHGTTTNYICKERLAWTPLPIIPNGEDAGPVFEVQNPFPFADGRDYKILRNDWPYGLEKGVEHLVVWLKNRLPVDPASEIGDLEVGAREAVE